ncbi:Bowman-Birk type bran trypsin inhibitor-like [Panicum miliaceum]|uniref:Bowman-Birk type bran trypsin inhibitor-like n=1 Tax=Panicum miliaceum TaxID=4540 RepID=A0A3L6Q8N5_PANMI|nr:Bowman-Birk type bran trypsin inhibitor-like [Panicum miliaceum]
MKSSSGMGTVSTVVLALLVVAALATAAVARPSHAGAIRLPTSRPWECCDFIVRDPDFRPPRWQCNDVAAECPAACRRCEEAPGGGGYVCRDWVVSLLEPPVCTPRPWDCCGAAVCTRAYVPYCRCADEVEACPSNCSECEQVEADPQRYRCLDQFHGYPGPKCTPFTGN